MRNFTVTNSQPSTSRVRNLNYNYRFVLVSKSPLFRRRAQRTSRLTTSCSPPSLPSSYPLSGKTPSLPNLTSSLNSDRPSTIDHRTTEPAITTVGYGEITPRSVLGRLLSVPLLVCGLLLIALPSFVLGREFSIVWEMMGGADGDGGDGDGGGDHLDLGLDADLDLGLGAGAGGRDGREREEQVMLETGGEERVGMARTVGMGVGLGMRSAMAMSTARLVDDVRAFSLIVLPLSRTFVTYANGKSLLLPPSYVQDMLGQEITRTRTRARRRSSLGLGVPFSSVSRPSILQCSISSATPTQTHAYLRPPIHPPIHSLAH